MTIIRPELQKFVELMENKLKANDFKGGWQECKLEWLVVRLKQEVGELEEAIMCGKNITDEAIDVANFAMMIADNCGEK